MTVPNDPTEVQGQAPVEQGTDTQETNVAPWADYLKDLPESVHPLVEPAFKQWDADVTKKFQSLHSEYEPYKPIFDEYEPDALMQAVQIISQLEANPAETIAQLQQALGLTPEQGTANSVAPPVQQVDPETDFSTPDPYAEKFQQMETMLETLANVLLQQQEQTQQQTQEQQLDEMLTSLKGKHGEFDETYVLTLMAQGVDPDNAVQQFKQTISQYAQQLNAPQEQAPTVIGNGGYPATPVTPQDLSSSKATVDLVTQMLAQAAENNK